MLSSLKKSSLSKSKDFFLLSLQMNKIVGLYEKCSIIHKEQEVLCWTMNASIPIGWKFSIKLTYM